MYSVHLTGKFWISSPKTSYQSQVVMVLVDPCTIFTLRREDEIWMT